MANLGNLLGSFVQSAMSQSGQGRLGNMVHDMEASAGSQPEAGGGLGGILGNVMQMAKGTVGSAAENPLQAAGIGAVIGSLLGGGGSSISGAVKGGALAVLAGVAYKALAGNLQGRAAGPVAASAPEVPVALQGPQGQADDAVVEQKARLVIKGMMNVAKSDGQVSADEVLRITSRLKEAGMDADTESWIMAELRHPLDLDAFVAEIPDQQTAAEIYAASLLAVEVDTPQERTYLSDYAQKTGIDGPVARQIEQTLGVQL